jgi:hypothetical protein
MQLLQGGEGGVGRGEWGGGTAGEEGMHTVEADNWVGCATTKPKRRDELSAARSAVTRP